MPDASNVDHRQRIPDRNSLWVSFLLPAAGLGIVLLLGMLRIAFGPPAALFGVIAGALILALVVRRYRFSLRTLFLVMTVFGIWLGLKLNRDAELNRALSAIENGGGRLVVTDRRSDFPWGLWKSRYSLEYHGLEHPISKEDLLHLETLAPSSVCWLNLANTGITDTDLGRIKGLTDLEFLSLSNETYLTGEVIPNRPQNSITDAGLARLGQLKNLKGIDLSGTAVTDDGLKLLAAMPHLIWVYLDGTNVSGSGLDHLGSHKHLMMLELNGCNLTPTGYRELIQIPTLISLGLNNSGCTDEDLGLLAKNTSLGVVRLNRSNVTKEAVHQFQILHPKCRIEY